MAGHHSFPVGDVLQFLDTDVSGDGDSNDDFDGYVDDESDSDSDNDDCRRDEDLGMEVDSNSQS